MEAKSGIVGFGAYPDRPPLSIKHSIIKRLSNNTLPGSPLARLLVDKVERLDGAAHGETARSPDNRRTEPSTPFQASPISGFHRKERYERPA
jgi:hypothetical protein